MIFVLKRLLIRLKDASFRMHAATVECLLSCFRTRGTLQLFVLCAARQVPSITRESIYLPKVRRPSMENACQDLQALKISITPKGLLSKCSTCIITRHFLFPSFFWPICSTIPRRFSCTFPANAPEVIEKGFLYLSSRTKGLSGRKEQFSSDRKKFLENIPCS